MQSFESSRVMSVSQKHGNGWETSWEAVRDYTEIVSNLVRGGSVCV